MCFTGNHILPDEDLAAFHWSLLGPEHPLASLKVMCPIFCVYIHSSGFDWGFDRIIIFH